MTTAGGVPALGSAAPPLHTADDVLQLLLMTRLAGRPAGESAAEADPAIHQLAGRLIRRLHDAEPAAIDDDIAAATARKLKQWIDRGRLLLGADDIAFSREQLRPLAALGPMPTVPCHMDNQPRNWLVDVGGAVSLIDFGRCERDVWIRDMNRLYFQHWAGRPDLRDAYYAGYGRMPDSAEAADQAVTV